MNRFQKGDFNFNLRRYDEGVGIIHMSRNGTINSFNATCQDVFGISSSEVGRRSFPVSKPVFKARLCIKT
jgi:hypothetical protein